MVEDLITRIGVFEVALLLAQWISVFYIIRKRHPSSERAAFFAYAAYTLFAYNVYIKGVHDFNIPIPHTFLNKIKVAGPIYIVDVLTTCIIGHSLAQKLRSNPRNSGGRLIFSSPWHTDLVIYLLSLLGFALYSIFHPQIDTQAQFRLLRGLLIGYSQLYLFGKVLANSKFEESRFSGQISTLSYIDAINIAGQLGCAYLYNDIVWQRGGHNVIVIDQAIYLLAASYLPYLLTRSERSSFLAVMAWITAALASYNYIKAYILLIPIFFIFYFAITISSGRVKKSWIYGTAFAIACFAPLAYQLTSDKAISGTRGTQLSAYLQYISEDASAIIFGSGVGGMYPVNVDTDDGGEIKAGDLSDSSVFQTEFQVPLFIYFKLAGVLSIFLLTWQIYIYISHAKRMLPLNQDGAGFLILGAILSMNTPVFITSSPNEAAYYCKILFIISGSFLLLKRNKAPSGKIYESKYLYKHADTTE